MDRLSGPYERVDGTWGWRQYGDNHSDIVATDGGQGYESKEDAAEMYEKVVGGHYSQRLYR